MIHTDLARLARRDNPSTRAKFLIGTAIAIGAGATIFFATRRAAAASHAKTAFEVSPDCMTIRIVDESAAKAAGIAAALVIHPSPNDPALESAQAILNLVFPSCAWSEIPPGLTFIHVGARYTWAEIEDLIGGRTVGELTQLVGAAPGQIAQPLPRIIDWILRPSTVAQRAR